MTPLSGRLEDQTAAELLRTLARSAATGKLTLTRRDRHAILVFPSGRIIYAASSFALERALVNSRERSLEQMRRA